MNRIYRKIRLFLFSYFGIPYKEVVKLTIIFDESHTEVEKDNFIEWLRDDLAKEGIIL